MNLKLASAQVLLAAVAVLHTALVLSQVPLQSRTIQPSAAATADFTRALKAAPGAALYGLATFSRHPTADERKALEAAGLRILGPLYRKTYRVRTEKHFDPATVKTLQITVQLTRLTPEDRVEPNIWRGNYAKYTVRPPGEKPRSYVQTATGDLSLSVRAHPGVSDADSRQALAKHTLSHQKQGDVWIVVMNPSSLRALAAEEVVEWIDAGPPPFLPENDAARTAIYVDAVQNFDVTTGQVTGSGGAGVQVAIFDKGIDEMHGDFAARVIRNDAPLHTHATHLAGSVAGSGVLSTGSGSWGGNNGGTAYQWRGMAPLAQLIDADQTTAGDPAKYLDFITSNGMDISNHSYFFSLDGQYGDVNRTRDQITRGDALAGTTAVPPRLQVVSAGNHGESPINGGSQVGYFSLTKQVKNGLVVGNWDPIAGRIASTSSLGPTHDGRIKPDVVAPGNGVMSTGYCAGTESSSYCLNGGVSTERRNFYRAGVGTSMASAVATGALALVLEKYAATYSVNLDIKPPLPSTLRAVMIHTAVDKQTASAWNPPNADGEIKPGPGPDFVTGWGLINAQDAVNIVANRRLVEGVIPATCHVKTFTFFLPAGISIPLRVTLAWDDPASPSMEDPVASKLVNDLDLILVAPNGAQYYPWKLDQQIENSAGNVIPDAAQLCGMDLNVRRQFTPVADPSAGNDTIPAGGVPSAVKGRDHLNNVEVVDTPPAFQAGIWLAKVVGFNVSEGPQKFSLVGRSFSSFHVHPTSLCVVYPTLCEKLAIRVNLCERFPRLCDPGFSFPGQDRIRVNFTDRRQKLILPFDVTCRHALNCPPCAASRTCPRYDVIGSTTGAVRGAIYTSAGELVEPEVSGRGASLRIQFAATPGESYFLVLSPGPSTTLGANYDIGLRMQ